MALRGLLLAPVLLVRPAMAVIFPLRGRLLAMTVRITPVSWVMPTTGVMPATGVMGIVGAVAVWVAFMRLLPCIVWGGFRFAPHGDRR